MKHTTDKQWCMNKLKYTTVFALEEKKSVCGRSGVQNNNRDTKYGDISRLVITERSNIFVRFPK